MIRTGTLRIIGNDSRLDDGTLLARCSESNPLAAATAFIKNRNFRDGDRVQVSGNHGTIGGVAVFCMDDIRAADSAAMLAPQNAPKEVATTEKAGKLKTGAKKRGSQKTRKQGAKKRV